MLEPINQQYVRVGQIAQSRGVSGTVLMIPERRNPHLFDEIDIVHLLNERGDLIPARIASCKIQQSDHLSFFLHFDHIQDRNQADGIKNFAVYLHRDKLDQTNADDENKLISFRVVDKDGKNVGSVEEIINNTVQAILSISTPDRKLLVPCVDEYITEIDEADSIIYCQNLDQLKNI